MNYYNEFDPGAAAWLRELIADGQIPAGDVDERSIEDVRPDELMGYTQCHFFAGIGGWPLALRLAGIPDTFRIWTGSCPCQPFSAAGAGAGTDDPRHLWPHFAWLIRQCRPAKVCGEQVASKSGRAWFAGVRADLEALGYAVAGADMCAAGVGAPHIRQRIYWMGNADIQGSQGHTGHGGAEGRQGPSGSDAAPSVSGGLAYANGGQREQQPGVERPAGLLGAPHGKAGIVNRFGDHSAGARGVADTDGKQQPHGQPGVCDVDAPGGREQGSAEASGLRGDIRPGPTNGFWADADWLFCRDGKWRPVEPGTFPLAHGIPARVGRLRGYGNAIVPQVAAEFLKAWLITEAA